MYLNVFRNRKRADIDAAAYADDAARMEALARQQPGFLAYRSYKSDDGESLSMSEWTSAEHARAWARHAEHLAVQARGRADYYDSYTVYSCDAPDVRVFSARDQT
jgi:heme-degrading monooxygenase HmoA